MSPAACSPHEGALNSDAKRSAARRKEIVQFDSQEAVICHERCTHIHDRLSTLRTRLQPIGTVIFSKVAYMNLSAWVQGPSQI